MDKILIANECMDIRKWCREQGVVCKLDMEKAYDREQGKELGLLGKWL